MNNVYSPVLFYPVYTSPEFVLFSHHAHQTGQRWRQQDGRGSCRQWARAAATVVVTAVIVAHGVATVIVVTKTSVAVIVWVEVDDSTQIRALKTQRQTQ